MLLIDKLAEQKITEASQRGELDDLPGQGQPLQLDDDAMVPEELRVGMRLLKNAGYLPAELQLRRDIESVESLIIQARSAEEQKNLSAKLRYLLMQLSIACPDSVVLSESTYLDKISDR